MNKPKNDDMLKSEMRGNIETLIRNGQLQKDYISSDNWDDIKRQVIEFSNDKRYIYFTYDDIYPNPPNPYIKNRVGGRRKSRKNRRKSKKSRKHRRKSKRHSRR